MRLAKILLIIILFIVAIFPIAPANAVQENETIITVVSVNDSSSFDTEVMLAKNGKILLGVKQIADILEIPVTINHSAKEIKFANAKINKSDVYLNGQKVPSQNVYLKKGIMDNVQDEIFIDEQALSKIFEATIKTDKNDFSVLINTTKSLSYLKGQLSEETVKEDTRPYKTYTDILVPQKRAGITLDSIGFSNYMSTDTTRQVFLNSSNSNVMFNNNSNFILKGRLAGGKYALDMNSNSYSGSGLSFGGIGLKYSNEYKNIPYELGRITGFKSEKYQLGSSVIGLQVFNYDATLADYKTIDGNVGEQSNVNVYINDNFVKTLDTYKGYFSLKDVYTYANVEKLALEELKQDGSTEVFMVKKYPKHPGQLLDGQKRISALVGLSGFNDRLFSQNGYIYQMNTKKFVLGTQYQSQIGTKGIYDLRVMGDKIISEDNSTIWGQSYYNNRSILSSGTYSNPNILEGVSVLNTYKHRLNDNFTLSTDVGASYSNDGLGQSLYLNSEYTGDKFSLKTSIYGISPKFYLAGSESAFNTDKVGVGINGINQFKHFSVNTSINRYFSNLNKDYDGGLTSYMEGALGINGKIPKVASLNFSSNLRQGDNTLGKNLSCYWDFNLSRSFKRLSLQAGRRDNIYQTEYSSMKFGDNFKSLYSTLYAKADIKIPKNKGVLTMAHEIIENSTNDKDNGYSSFRLGFSFPEFKRVLLSTSIGKNYGGSNDGINYGAGLGYRTKSGMVVSLNYQYNADGGYIFDNMYIPANNRHSINLTFNDTLAVVPGGGLKSVGYSDNEKGYVEVTAYIDKNQNGIFDSGDIGVKNVPIKTSWKDELVYTGMGGSTPIEVVDKGVGKVSLDISKLPGTFSNKNGAKEYYLVLVKPKSTTKVEFPLLCSVGSVQGSLKITDSFDRTADTKDFVVVMLDEQGQEIAYSTVDDYGDYYFSGIAPGKYTIKLDENIIEEHGFEPSANKGEIKVEIPYTQKEFIDIKGLNLVYKS